MGKKRQIDSSFWSDPWIVDALNPLDRYLFLYLLTNERNNLAGCYEISLRTIANETGLDKDEVTRMMVKMESRVVYQDGWVVLRKAIQNQNYHNPQIGAGIVSLLKSVPRGIFHYILFPADFGEYVRSELSLDESSMSLDESSYLIQFNLIQSNTKRNTLVDAAADAPSPTAAQSPKLPNYSDKQKNDIKRVYAEYCKCFAKNMNTYKLTDKRKAKIAARLREFSVEDLLLAIRNISADDFYTGGGDRKWFAHLDWIFNSYERTEEWVNGRQAATKPKSKIELAQERHAARRRELGLEDDK